MVEIDTKNEIIKTITESLKSLCPHCDDGYQMGIAAELVDHFEKIGGLDKDAALIYGLSFNENAVVKAMKSLIYQIKKDLLEDGYSYLQPDDKPKNDYERGVLGAMGVIKSRVRAICD